MTVPLSIRLLAAGRGRARGDLLDPANLTRARGPYVPTDVPVVGGVLERLLRAATGRLAQGVTTEVITVPGAAGDLTARRHVPDRREPDAPLVLHLHGGGWTIGNPVQYDWLCTQLASRLGAVVVSPAYRLAPEHPAPAAADDARAVAKWLLAGGGGEVIGSDGPLVVVGDSAGGNLSALVAIAARDGGWGRVAAQLLIYPSVDLTRSFPSAQQLRDEPILTGEMMDQFIAAYVSGDVAADDPAISPWYVDDVANLAPTFVMTAAHDPLQDEGRAYAERLAEAGVTVRHTEYVDMPHGFAQLPGLARAAGQSLAEMVDFVRTVR